MKKEPDSNIATIDEYLAEEPPCLPPNIVCNDESTQVDFWDDRREESPNIFICSRIVYEEKCDVETQVDLKECPSKKSAAKTVVTKEMGCGPDISSFHDKCVGPELIDFNNKSMIKCVSGFHGHSSIMNDEEMLSVAGVTREVFDFFLRCLGKSGNEKLSIQNRLLLFLMRMKLGLSSRALAVIFQVHRTTAARYFKTILESLSSKCKKLIKWPSKESVQASMPDAFKLSYGACRVIIDCTEFPVEQPPEVNQRVHFYSHYKKGYTIKVLVGCTPSGYISLISEGSGGRKTDAQITNHSGLLSLLEPGDLVLADKGFPEIKTRLDELGKNVLFVMPPFLRSDYFTAEEVQETREVANLRIHIERIMSRIKTYQIVSKFTIKMLPYANAIILMSCILVNLQPPILKVDKGESDDT